MLKKIIFFSFCISILVISACSSGTENNSNSSKSATNQKNLPKGINTKPIEPDGKTTPGIPDPKNLNSNKMPKGTTPTPGIPDPKNMGKTPVPKGATPTPGIPSPEELERQKKRKVNIDEVNNPKNSKSDGKVVTPNERKRKTKNKP